MIIVRLLSPGPWLVGTTKVYSGVGADIVMESITPRTSQLVETPSVGATFTKLGRFADTCRLQIPQHSVLSRQFATRLCTVSASVRVAKIAIDKRARESEKKGHEENLAGVLPASCGCAAKKQPLTATAPPIRSQLPPPIAELIEHCVIVKQENANTVTCSCLPRDHCYRFKNGAHQASLQENERGKMKSGTGDWRANPISARSLFAML
jgi:hypothetical protein